MQVDYNFIENNEHKQLYYKAELMHGLIEVQRVIAIQRMEKLFPALYFREGCMMECHLE